MEYSWQFSYGQSRIIKIGGNMQENQSQSRRSRNTAQVIDSGYFAPNPFRNRNLQTRTPRKPLIPYILRPRYPGKLKILLQVHPGVHARHLVAVTVEHLRRDRLRKRARIDPPLM